MMNTSIKWYLARIGSMSPQEFVYRLRIALVNKLAEFKKGKNFKNCYYTGYNTIFNPDHINYDLDISSIRLFDLQIPLKNKYNWHFDPYSKLEFPKVFSKKINTRGFNNMSAKHVWELNRMQFLPQIALKFRVTGDKKYLDLIKDLMLSWIDDNPYMIGINWYSNIELGLRLINWAITWDILDIQSITGKSKSFDHFITQKWFPVIYAHCKRIRQSLSRFSSANNHLVAELAGLFVASSFWHFKESGKWKKFSKSELEKEIIKQHSKHGINLEETSGYIQYITDLFLLSWFYAERTRNSFSNQYDERLRNIFHYIFQLIDSKGNLIRYGDADDGHALFLENDDYLYNFKSLLTTGSILFNEPVFKGKCSGYDCRNQLFFGEKYQAEFNDVDSLVPANEKSKFYPDEGHFFFRKSLADKEILLHFNAASLGYLSIAAHGHADALSYVLHVDGIPIIVDCGTYTIHTQQDFRKYFKGTLAHNTIRVDNQDQALYKGPSLWNDHYRTKVLHYKLNEVTEESRANHDGYLKNGVIHMRSIRFNKAENKFLIQDTLNISDGKLHQFELCHHLSPDVTIERKTNNILLLKCSPARVTEIRTDKQLNIELIKGQRDPILGYYSSGFHSIQDTTVIYSKFESSKSIVIYTEIFVID
ncbi:MAG: alginate lyase family protein [Bacteroidales bacterium]|nr:alginate lyase family protein [Bacteroidales bacterium]